MAKRKHRVLARNPDNNNVQKVWRKEGGGFTRNGKKPLAGNVPGLFSAAEAKQAVAWGKRKGLAMYVTTSKFPFIVLDKDTYWGNPKLAGRLDRLGELRERYVWVGEFKRTAHRQWQLRMLYLSGEGNNAARCCSKYDLEPHTWKQCGKDSWSNHADGNAADASILHSGRGGPYTNLGNDQKSRAIMHRLDLCLPVPDEPWHAERGDTWNA